jgi:hypothetical protein
MVPRIGLLLGTALTMSVALTAIEVQARPDKGHSSSAQDRSDRNNTGHGRHDRAKGGGSKAHRESVKTNHQQEQREAKSHDRRDRGSYGKAKSEHSEHNGRANPDEISSKSNRRNINNQQSKLITVQPLHAEELNSSKEQSLSRSDGQSQSRQMAHARLTAEGLAHPTKNEKPTALPSHGGSKISHTLKHIDANQRLRSELKQKLGTKSLMLDRLPSPESKRERLALDQIRNDLARFANAAERSRMLARKDPAALEAIMEKAGLGRREREDVRKELLERPNEGPTKKAAAKMISQPLTQAFTSLLRGIKDPAPAAQKMRETLLDFALVEQRVEGDVLEYLGMKLPTREISDPPPPESTGSRVRLHERPSPRSLRPTSKVSASTVMTSSSTQKVSQTTERSNKIDDRSPRRGCRFQLSRGGCIISPMPSY